MLLHVDFQHCYNIDKNGVPEEFKTKKILCTDCLLFYFFFLAKKANIFFQLEIFPWMNEGRKISTFQIKFLLSKKLNLWKNSLRKNIIFVVIMNGKKSLGVLWLLARQKKSLGQTSLSHVHWWESKQTPPAVLTFPVKWPSSTFYDFPWQPFEVNRMWDQILL